MTPSGPILLLIGSAPSAVDCRDWARAPFDGIVAINNAWRIRPDWDWSIYPEDFPPERRATPKGSQTMVEADAFVPEQNRYGGVLYAGGTMAFTAGYWALGALKPRVMAYIGCDMTYPRTGATHFYGQGAADPLRDDISLRSLEAKSARLMLIAARQGCACVNLSTAPSRLVFPRANQDQLDAIAQSGPAQTLDGMAAAEAEEARLGYMEPSGRYWEVAERFDPAAIDRVDALWRAAAGLPDQLSA